MTDYEKNLKDLDDMFKAGMLSAEDYKKAKKQLMENKNLAPQPEENSANNKANKMIYEYTGDFDADEEAFRLGQQRLKINDIKRAVKSFEEAAYNGHEGARTVLEDLYKQGHIKSLPDYTPYTETEYENLSSQLERKLKELSDMYKTEKIDAEEYSKEKTYFISERISENPKYFMAIGDWVFYCNENDGRKLYKIFIDGSNKKKLNDDECKYPNSKKDWCYYINTGDGDKIYKIRTNGTDRQKLNDVKVSNIVFVDDEFIGFTIDYKLYNMRTDGTDMKLVE